MDEVAALQQWLRRARLRRGRSTRSSAQIPCNLPTRRTDEGLRRADSGPDRLEGCLRLCQRRRVVAFVRWSSVLAPESRSRRSSAAWRLSWTKGLGRAAGTGSNLLAGRCRMAGRLRLRGGDLRRPSSGGLLRERSLRRSFTA